MGLFSKSRVVSVVALVALFGQWRGVPAPAQGSAALAKAFATGFVSGFEKTTGVKMPAGEASCVGTRFVPRVKVSELAKIKKIDDLTAAQRAALVDSLALCMGPETYRQVLDKKLTVMKPAARSCFEAAVLRLGVPKLLAVDFEDFLQKPQAATKAQVSKLALGCAK